MFLKPSTTRTRPILALLLAAIALHSTAQTAKPKVLLLFDMEGVSGVNREVQCEYPTPEYEQARHLLTEDVNAAIRGLVAGGAGDIVVVDGHGSGNWREPDVIVADMDKRGTIGYSYTPYDPYLSPDSSYRAIVSIGAHASAGKPGFLSHTRARISAYKLNGIELTETTIIGLSAMQYGIPVIMVSGDDVLEAQIKQQFPDVEYGLVKDARGVRDARLLPLEIAHHNIQHAAQSAMQKLSSYRPLAFTKPYHFEVAYRNKRQADYAAAFPGVLRLDSITIGYTTADIVTGLNIGKAATRLAEQEFEDLLLEVIRKRPDGQVILEEWHRELDDRWFDSVHDDAKPMPPFINTSPTAKPGEPQRFWGDF